tara:strand:- start:1117 stop:2478 length:1362 start_codon:yes stop_codon:yes gene_type:complete
MLINISGSSGVGKTTISNIFRYVLSQKHQEVLVLSGDDLHKWERDDPNWNAYTHLDPRANNIEDGTNQILDLLNGKDIYRAFYDHKTGKRDPKVTLKNPGIIINEGLHALYPKALTDLSDLNVFVDTDRDLTTQWKINRDTIQRGYKLNDVLDTIRRRESDERRYIMPQAHVANIILKFVEKNRSVDLELVSCDADSLPLINMVLDFYKLHKEFLFTCKRASFEYDLVQGAGGNISYKFDDKIVITSSGMTMSDISMLNGFSVCYKNDLKRIEGKRQSMETPIHSYIKQPCIVHTHPIYLNALLCSKEGREILEEIIPYKFTYIEYTTPGKALAERVKEEPLEDIILLENHGLFIGAPTLHDAYELSFRISQICKTWLIRNAKIFNLFSREHNKVYHLPLFPDAVILPKDTDPLNNYIVSLQEEVNLTSKFLSSEEIAVLENMEEEKYRKNLK